jgi:COP9 signalosome complex subunit 6
MSKTGEAQSNLDISLHALVVVSISDHYTRSRVRSGADRVFGMLLGIQQGRKVEIFSSFECAVNPEGQLDAEYLEARKNAAKIVMPKYEVMGWYATGKDLSQTEKVMYEQVLPLNESPLLLLLDVNPDPSAREIPMTLYETEYKAVGEGNPELKFLKTMYRIETSDSERLAVDHIARATNAPSGGPGAQSQLTSHLDSMFRAIKMLRMRVGIIIEYLKATEQLQLPSNMALLRRISSLTHMLPAIDGDHFKQEFLDEFNDTVLLTYLASIMKASATVNELIDKFNLTYDKHGRRRAGY